MGKTFVYTVKSDPKEILSKLKTMLKAHPEIPFSGDEQSGRIENWRGFEGSYRMNRTPSDTTVEIVVSQKPFPVPWGMIKSKLDSEARKW